MWQMFRCSHKKFSSPMSRRRKDNVINRQLEIYVICLDCNERFPYSLSEARRVCERRKQREDFGDSLVAAMKNRGSGRTGASDGKRKMEEDVEPTPAPSATGRPTGVTLPHSTAGLAAGAVATDPGKASGASFHAKRRLSPQNSIPMRSEPAVNASTVTSLHKLAFFYHSKKDYEGAERLYIQALAAAENSTKSDGVQHREIEKLCNNLANVYHRLGK